MSELAAVENSLVPNASMPSYTDVNPNSTVIRPPPVQGPRGLSITPVVTPGNPFNIVRTDVDNNDTSHNPIYAGFAQHPTISYKRQEAQIPLQEGTVMFQMKMSLRAKNSGFLYATHSLSEVNTLLRRKTEAFYTAVREGDADSVFLNDHLQTYGYMLINQYHQMLHRNQSMDGKTENRVFAGYIAGDTDGSNMSRQMSRIYQLLKSDRFFPLSPMSIVDRVVPIGVFEASTTPLDDASSYDPTVQNVESISVLVHGRSEKLRNVWGPGSKAVHGSFLYFVLRPNDRGFDGPTKDNSYFQFYPVTTPMSDYPDISEMHYMGPNDYIETAIAFKFAELLQHKGDPRKTVDKAILMQACGCDPKKSIREAQASLERLNMMVAYVCPKY